MDNFACAGRVAVLIGNQWNEKRVMHSLQAVGLYVETTQNGLALLSLLGRQPMDAVLVEDRRDDLVECLASLRFRGLTGIPVIAVGQGSIHQIIDALSEGASDYVGITDTAESLAYRVLARIVLSRRPLDRTELQLGELVLDASSRMLRCPDNEFSLTSREFELAWMLFEHAGEVVNLQTLSQRVWGREACMAKRTIEQHISRVRQKLARAGAAAGALVQLRAIHNIGYRLTHAPLLRTLTQRNAVPLPAAA